VKRCLILAPYPFEQPRHGGQIRIAAISRALVEVGWQVVSASVYPETFFASAQRGREDIVLNDAALCEAALDDHLFADMIAARHASRDLGAMDRLRGLLRRLRPDIVHLEQPWLWLPLREALKALKAAEQPAIVYSSQNIEWRMRPAMYRLGLRRPGSDARVAATRALEAELWRRADLVFSISDVEGKEIAQESAREVVYLPPTSDVADRVNADDRFAVEAMTAGVRYAGLLSSAYWPNLEGFFDMFPDGLGFLRADEQIWVAGSLGSALAADPRYRDFQTLNDTRMRQIGYVSDVEKVGFLGAAHCVIVPVLLGGGAKLKTADALASGHAVISTSQGIEGYGPLVAPALGRGVFVADSPAEFRALIRRALRDGLPGCDTSVRAALHPRRLIETIAPLYDRLWQMRRVGRSGDGAAAAAKPVKELVAMNESATTKAVPS
jgi:hypothetical protein